jgi:lipoprotein-anchoring transpeptidase ErfK/SrfK
MNREPTPIMTTEMLRVGILFVMCAISLFSCQARAEMPALRENGPKVIVSVRDQKMILVQDGHPIASYPVSTSRFGIGDRPGSYSTPLGRLTIRKTIGRGYPLGSVFNHRIPTGEILSPNAPGRDPIVTRILWLDGEEHQNRNAYSRCIYIHGTPQENLLGKPVSYGCIRMRSKDVATLAEIIPVGSPVVITESHLPKEHLPHHGLMASLACN